MFICLKDSFDGFILSGGGGGGQGGRKLLTWGSYYWKELCVSKLFWYIFGREAESVIFSAL